jgi:hypothetical protein
MNYVVLTYSIYLPVTILLTIWVANTLLRNGRAFLFDIFHKEKTLSDSVSNLLNVGVYLISLGFAFLALRLSYSDEVQSIQSVIEVLSSKLGGFIILLGLILFTNLLLLLAIRKSPRENSAAAAGEAVARR